ncbi:metaphase chromosome protein 1 [Leuconostocaceae bacterium ESL0958]|nr:metaphase chromosome protein 1 [Leuconostocaceae bacterium ESL0958]
MKQGKSAQIKKLKHQQQKQQKPGKQKLSPFNYDDFAGFLRARFYLTKKPVYDQKTFEVASFFLDDLLATMVKQNFSDFTADQRVIVNLNEAMQETLVSSSDRDWRYFLLLVPVLFDIQSFLAKEGQVNERYGVQTTKFDLNFWRMIIRTVLSVNYFRSQGQDVAKLMNESSAIDDLQFKFLQQDGDQDDFAIATIAEVFRGTTPVLPELKKATATALPEPLTAAEVTAEESFAQKEVAAFAAASTAGQVTEQERRLLLALHQGLAEKYQAKHEQWTAALIVTFIKQDLLTYWQPEWDALDGLGGEIYRYLLYLKQQDALTFDQAKMEQDLTDSDRYLDVLALNQLLAQLDLDTVETLSHDAAAH